MVEDVAVGDLDGDGRVEVVAVGAHWLVMLRYGGGQLAVEEVVVSGGMLRGLHLTGLNGENGVQLISGIAPPGLPRGQVWILEGAKLRREGRGYGQVEGRHHRCGRDRRGARPGVGSLGRGRSGGWLRCK